MKIHFFKYQGTGNDFIIMDNRSGEYNKLTTGAVKRLCDRRFGVGADGLMLLQNLEGYDFEMVYYNADGNPGSMCGNGGRCLVQFAYECGIHQKDYSFLATDGPHQARRNEDQTVSLQMKDVSGVQSDGAADVIDTGSPHYIKFVKNVLDLDVVGEGRAIRYSEAYKKKGINVNFVQVLPNATFYVRTYERGVEEETFSCGTGVTAAAIASPMSIRGTNTINIQTRGGKLRVDFDKIEEGAFKNIWLTGPADFVFEGTIQVKDEDI